MPDLKVQYQRAAAVFRAARRATIVIHRKPDGDALGAASAILAWCRAEGIDARLYCRDRAPSQYDFLPHIEALTTDPAALTGVPLVAVFDAGDLRYAAVADHLVGLDPRPRLLNFDHHADNERFGDINCVDDEAVATCEIVFRFLASVGAEITPPTATALLTGILFDTGSLSNPATTRRSLAASAELMRLGGSMHDYNTRILKSKSVAALRVWGEGLSRLRKNEAMDVATTALYADDLAAAGVDEEEVEGISNFLDAVLDTKASVFLKELPGGLVKGSLRTIHDLDVSVPARLMGGGGHRKAAGFTVPGRIVETDTGFRVEKLRLP